MSNQEKQIVRIDDLYSEKTNDIVKQNQLNVLLNHPPKAEWVKQHPFAKNVKYMPVERVEYLLTSIFVKWQLEVKEIKLIANSVVAIVRLHYLDPVTSQWNYHDGVGASPLQTDEGAGAIDFNAIKSNAVMLAAPSAESYALKDAAEKLGKLFGKDLNRKDEIAYNNLQGKFAIRQLKERLSEKIVQCQDLELNKEVTQEVIEAEDAGVNTEDFYNRMIAKYE